MKWQKDLEEAQQRKYSILSIYIYGLFLSFSCNDHQTNTRPNDNHCSSCYRSFLPSNVCLFPSKAFGHKPKTTDQAKRLRACCSSFRRLAKPMPSMTSQKVPSPMQSRARPSSLTLVVIGLISIAVSTSWGLASAVSLPRRHDLLLSSFGVRNTGKEEIRYHSREPF